MILNDFAAVDGNVRRTPDGYLAATARVARIGIQVYSGAEVGKPELSTVKVYRPPEEVFADATMKSFAHRPVTLDHPGSRVNASNWRDVAVGQTGGKVHRDGDYIVVDLAMMDENAIRAFESGKRQLSMGYDCELEFVSGTTPAGERYDAIQRGIRNNHVALVTVARGGPQLRIGDSVEHGSQARFHDAIRERDSQSSVPQRGLDAQTALDAHYSQVLAAKDAALAGQLQHLADQRGQIDAHTERFAAQFAARDAASKATPRDRAYADACAQLNYRGRG